MATNGDRIYIEKPYGINLDDRAWWEYEHNQNQHVFAHHVSGNAPKAQIRTIKTTPQANESYEITVSVNPGAFDALKVQLRENLPDLRYEIMPRKDQAREVDEEQDNKAHELKFILDKSNKFKIFPALMIVLQQIQTLPQPIREQLYSSCGLPYEQEDNDNAKLVTNATQGKDAKVKSALMDQALKHAALTRNLKSYLAIARTCDSIPALADKKPKALQAAIDLYETNAVVRLNTPREVMGEIYELSAQDKFATFCQQTNQAGTSENKDLHEVAKLALGNSEQEKLLQSAFKDALKGTQAGNLDAGRLLKEILMRTTRISEAEYAAIRFDTRDIKASAACFWRMITTGHSEFLARPLVKVSATSLNSDAPQATSEKKEGEENEELKQIHEKAVIQLQPKAKFYSFFLGDHSCLDHPVSSWEKATPLQQIMDKGGKPLTCYGYVSSTLPTGLFLDQIVVEDELTINPETTKDLVFGFKVSTQGGTGEHSFSSAVTKVPSPWTYKSSGETHPDLDEICYLQAYIPKSKKVPTLLEAFTTLEQQTILSTPLKEKLFDMMRVDYQEALSWRFNRLLAAIVKEKSVDFQKLSEAMTFAGAHKQVSLYLKIANMCKKISDLKIHALVALKAGIQLVEDHSAIRNHLSSEIIGGLYSDAAEHLYYQKDANMISERPEERNTRLFDAFCYAQKSIQYGWTRVEALAEQIYTRWVEHLGSRIISGLEFNFSDPDVFAKTLWMVARNKSGDQLGLVSSSVAPSSMPGSNASPVTFSTTASAAAQALREKHHSTKALTATAADTSASPPVGTIITITPATTATAGTKLN